MRCKYPDCFNCDLPDCLAEENDILEMEGKPILEKQRLYNQKYKERIRQSLPQCNECEWVRFVNNSKMTGFCRLCRRENRMIEKNVSASPVWCYRREDDIFKRQSERRKAQ